MASPSSRFTGLRNFLLGKGALFAVILFGAPALAATLILGHHGSSEDTGKVAMVGGQSGASRIAAAAAPRGTLVTSASELRGVVENADDGAVVLLAPGRYPEIGLAGIRKPGTVTITSADPSRPAAIGRLIIRNSSGMVLRDLELAADASAAPAGNAEQGNEVLQGDGLTQQERRAQWQARQRAKAEGVATGSPAQAARRPAGLQVRFPFMIVGSERITLDRLHIHGPLEDKAAAYRIPALMIRGSQQVTVSNSRFHTLKHGLAMLELDGITIRNNEFTDIRTDGVRGGDISNAEIAGNIFTDFHPAPGDHPDGIQLWSTPRGRPMTNISIHDNMVVRGNGGPTQGIFMRDVKNNLIFHNVDIRDNLVMGGLYNGIAINGVQDGKIRDNMVINYSDRKHSWIRVDNSQGIEMKRNRASKFIVSRSTVDDGENAIYGGGTRNEARDVAKWLDAKPGRRRADSLLQRELAASAGS